MTSNSFLIIAPEGAINVNFEGVIEVNREKTSIDASKVRHSFYYMGKNNHFAYELVPYYFDNCRLDNGRLLAVKPNCTQEHNAVMVCAKKVIAENSDSSHFLGEIGGLDCVLFTPKDETISFQIDDASTVTVNLKTVVVDVESL